MIECYPINQENPYSFIFLTEKKIEYQMVLKPSGIEYKNAQGMIKDVPDVALNCDINTASKDYKTSKTLVSFCSMLFKKNDAILMQIHNQPESLENDKILRRGSSRIKLWSRLTQKYFKDHILLTNLVLSPNKNSDIFCIVVNKNSAQFKEIVTNFYRFCYYRMYKIKN